MMEHFVTSQTLMEEVQETSKKKTVMESVKRMVFYGIPSAKKVFTISDVVFAHPSAQTA